MWNLLFVVDACGLVGMCVYGIAVIVVEFQLCFVGSLVYVGRLMCLWYCCVWCRVLATFRGFSCVR